MDAAYVCTLIILFVWRTLAATQLSQKKGGEWLLQKYAPCNDRQQSSSLGSYKNFTAPEAQRS